MISFRYHIVSLVGVFLALALGIVVGTTALNGPITSDLRRQLNQSNDQRTSFSQQVKTLSGQVDNAQNFASTYGAQIVKATLTGQNVLILGMPNADSGVKDGISKQIVNAGGKIAGRLQLTSDYIDPKRANDVVTLATSTIHPIGLTLPTKDDAGSLGGALLGWVLLGKGQPSDLRSVLSGFSELHMITVESSGDVGTATMVVVVAAGTPTDAGGQTELNTVSELQKTGGQLVVAGDSPSATKGGLVALVRNASDVRGSVSTVDNADTAMGQVSSVLALAAIGQSQVGHFGTGSGADSLFPEPPR